MAILRQDGVGQRLVIEELIQRFRIGEQLDERDMLSL